ncbi:site-specific DNA-methyltransferase [Mycoplasmopsis felis]|uniref:site-specific DNA-methyltransferase n=1 Tax=Mycoplasmopsis felis TaxID=33923 RepID=UPI002AFE0BDE|nr:site-specific DNA-methyltransferase [Mycoplasmopsis felis]WQQ07787.1 site-specific DNA-methyltransferase [Mycoplasmopsis felis]
MNKNLFEEVTELLLSNPKYVSSDNKLLKAIVYTDIMNLDTNLLAMLLSNKLVKSTFFQNVNDTLVFDKQKFAWFIDSKEFLPDSYTRYTNKIGLTSNGEYLSKSNNVVLDFPYKDCFLVGGQNKDDQKRDEIFYNEIIASDQISTMLSPKVFTNVKKYTVDGIQENILFNENDNLIIKGNNLIVLSSLLKRYEGKVKCIYIDPPYNTGNDSFNYNDSFNHSTWLVFMKNRLELAKRLLSEDGYIYISIDDKELSYLSILMDEIFGNLNFIGIFPRLTTKGGGRFGNSFSKNNNNIKQDIDFVVSYSKNKLNINLNKITPDIEWDDYKLIDERGKFVAKHPLISKGQSGNPSYNYEFSFDGKLWKPPIGEYWVYSKERIDFLIRNNFLYVNSKNNIYIKNYKDYEIKIISKNNYEIAKKENGTDLTYSKLFFMENNFLNSEGKKDLKNDSFSYPKPEKLIEKLLEASTKENDLVLDFHLGSGTTAAVAHKMNRRYIGIEQMDYIEDIAVQRLKKVIDGEQGGISKSVNWNGGGSFVYFELLENANNLISLIQNTNEDNISHIKNLIYSDQRIIPFLTKKELLELDKAFETLSLLDKQKALIKLIDKNKLYVNYSDIDDQTYNVSQIDKNFTKSFYRGE